MTGETKISLLVGVGFTILIGILLSDHFSIAQRQGSPELARDLPELENPRREGTDLRANQSRVNRLINTLYQGGQPPRSAATADARRESQRLIAMQEPLPPAPDPQTVQDALPDLPGFERVPDPPAIPLTRSVAPVEPSPASAQRTHTVREGELLSDIARRHLGSSKAWPKLFEANRSVLSDPDTLRPGMKLVIPGAAPAATPSRHVAAPSAPAPQAQRTREYRIRKHEYLTDIAERVFGSRSAWPKLYAMNKDRIADPNRIRPGTLIRVPAR